MVRVVVLLTWALVGGAAAVRAEPMHTPLAEVAAQTESLLVATYVGPIDAKTTWDASAYHLDVHRTVWGKPRQGRITLALGSGHAEAQPGSEVVVFVGKGDTWSFVARPLPGQGLADGALQVIGFYDFNAHLVSPSIATLAQLEGFLAGGRKALSYRLRGHLQVLSAGGKRVETSPIEVTVASEWPGTAAGGATVLGIDPVNLPAPTLQVSPGWGAPFTLVYRRGWPRPLLLDATVEGVDGDGTYRVHWRVAMPDLFTLEETQRYLGDAGLSHPEWTYLLAIAKGPVWKLVDGVDYSSGPQLVVGKARRDYRSFSLAPQRTLDFGSEPDPLRIDLGPPAPGAFLGEGGGTRQFRQEVLHGPLPCTVRGGGQDGKACTITLEAVRLRGPIRAR